MAFQAEISLSSFFPFLEFHCGKFSQAFAFKFGKYLREHMELVARKFG